LGAPGADVDDVVGEALELDPAGQHHQLAEFGIHEWIVAREGKCLSRQIFLKLSPSAKRT
jgi:hypothetical protein